MRTGGGAADDDEEVNYYSRDVLPRHMMEKCQIGGGAGDASGAPCKKYKIDDFKLVKVLGTRATPHLHLHYHLNRYRSHTYTSLVLLIRILDLALDLVHCTYV